MKTYAEIEIFTPREVELLRQATHLISITEGEYRCHELARAVGTVLNLPHQDGWFDHVEHTWLWTRPLPSKPRRLLSPEKIPNILDVYVPGSIPEVQLINWAAFGLPWRRVYYINPIPRDDIQQEVVDRLVAGWRVRELRYP
jgi:hypothetical protein